MDPPWLEYEQRVKDLPLFKQDPSRYQAWTFEEIASIPIKEMADKPSFLFLWVGSSHLDEGRELFKKWDYKRCEDIVWIKTNKTDSDKKCQYNPGFLLQRVKEHCLVGLRGDVKRGNDSHFIHANIDTDVIVEEEPNLGNKINKKPSEIYDIIERFCLGRKR